MICVLFLFLLSRGYSTFLRDKRPHIIHILVDDLGWAELGYHRHDDEGDVNTSFIDELVRTESLELDRFYTHKICSPSRCAIQTGRAPIHVNVQNVKPEVRNEKDPIGGYQGIPLNMTTIGQYMSEANYTTHFVGKYDVGMATPDHSPRARGYDSFLGYWHHANDYWSFDEEKCEFKSVRDLWIQNDTYDGPAYSLQNGDSCSQTNQNPDSETCVFEEEILGKEVRRIISSHDVSSKPMFLFWSMHLVHMPLQVPNEYLERFSQIDDSYRRKMHAMTNYVDDEIRDITLLLKERNMWNNTLLVFHSDNGGEIMAAGICGGNNYPLRGGKFSNFEGGIRVNAFVSGGYLPPSRRGMRETGLITSWDWLRTFTAVAGLKNVTDERARKAGLPAIDSLNAWPLISGENMSSPRTRIFIGDTSAEFPNGDGETLVGGVILNRNGTLWKLLVGAADKLHTVSQNVITGPRYA